MTKLHRHTPLTQCPIEAAFREVKRTGEAQGVALTYLMKDSELPQDGRISDIVRFSSPRMRHGYEREFQAFRASVKCLYKLLYKEADHDQDRDEDERDAARSERIE